MSPAGGSESSATPRGAIPGLLGAVAEADLSIVSRQLGRQARDVTGVAARCPFGRPAVIETSPVLTDGMPNPTLLYLTCPSAVVAISRAESAGGVRRLKSAYRDDAPLRHALDDITRAYRERRAALAAGGDPRPEAGIGGPEAPEKASCLHAYAAALLAALSGWLESAPPGSAGGRAGDDRPGSGAPGRGTLGAAAGGPAVAADVAWDRFLPPCDSLWCDDDRCARWVAERESSAVLGEGGHARVAAIDVGTISVRLLVADLVEGRLRDILKKVEVTRLGEGLRPGGRLGKTAAARTAAVVRRYADEARRLGADRILIAGTSAARDAADGREFIAALGREVQVTAAVVTGEEEAALAYAGASLDIEGDRVVLDVGGGSTELIRRTSANVIETVSMDIGASRATERWRFSDPPLPEEKAAAYQEAAALLRRLRPRFGADAAGAPPSGLGEGSTRDNAGAARLVGVAGTVTTLACLDAGLKAYDSQLVHLRRLSLATVERLAEHLGGMTTAERAKLPCVQAGRAPVIVGGALIVKAAMEALGYCELVVSERDLLDGLVLREGSQLSS